jgi:hypothetical protein
MCLFLIYEFEGLISCNYLLSVQRQILELLEGWLRHKSDMVNFEAARAICEMKNVSPAQLTKPIAGKSICLLSVEICPFNNIAVT